MSEYIDKAKLNLKEMWLKMRDDASPTSMANAKAVILFAWHTFLLNGDEMELWTLRVATCPGHEGEGGRVWCAYCGNMPTEKILEKP